MLSDAEYGLEMYLKIQKFWSTSVYLVLLSVVCKSIDLPSGFIASSGLLTW